jgi:SAM-dependent methyltransferase
LLFRTPTDRPEHNSKFYEHEYSQGFTTELPSAEILAEYVKSNFSGTEKDYDYYIDVLKTAGLPRDARIFDFGCSWGYGSYQLRKAGYRVTSFEVSPTRRTYARKYLDVDTVDDLDAVERAKFDCFFSAHVLEHVPCPTEVIDHAHRLLKPNGFFISFTPNGSMNSRSKIESWERLWGEVHPNFIDDHFLDRSFQRSPRVIGSSPIGLFSFPTEPKLERINDLSGFELFFAARKSTGSW